MKLELVVIASKELSTQRNYEAVGGGDEGEEM